MEQKDLSLYLHIPFCAKKCAYCDFLSASADKITYDLYIQSLLGEIDAYRGSALSQRKVKTIFIGGGTPSILPAEAIAKLLQKIKSVFHISDKDWGTIEISMEMNPGTVTYEKCLQYRDGGINRISIGLQSACDEELKLLGRIHDYQTFLDTFQSVRKAGFENVNVDLMAALPGQTIHSYTESLQKVIALSPEHISAYSLIIEEGTPFFERYREGGEAFGELPDEETERRMYRITQEMLAGAGYGRYEISNYARKGRECLHNEVYWRRGDYLGLGLGASSLIDHIRYKNEENLAQYLSYWKERQQEKLQDTSRRKNSERSCHSHIVPIYDEYYQAELCKLTAEDEMAEFMFLGLRMMEGVSPQEFFACFGKDLMDVYGNQIEKHLSLGLLAWKDDETEVCHTDAYHTDAQSANTRQVDIQHTDSRQINARQSYRKENGYQQEGRLCLTPDGIDVSNAIFVDFL